MNVPLVRIVFVAPVVLAAGCATGGASGPALRAISLEEATSFQRSLQRPVTPPAPRDAVYAQPVNKKEPCLVASEATQQARPHFRAYWDGECRNGHAYGMGRDIAISDTHHVEEITIYDARGSNDSAPAVLYDFVNATVIYRMGAPGAPLANAFIEQFQNRVEGFNVVYRMGSFENGGGGQFVETSPFNPVRTTFNAQGAALYRFREVVGTPVVAPNEVRIMAELVDPRTGTVGGISSYVYGDGSSRNYVVDGTRREAVAVPPEYGVQLRAKYLDVTNALPLVNANVERARTLEREYLYMACSGKHTIQGLAPSDATKICTWRDQFKPQYAESLAKFNRSLEDLKRQAAHAEDVRQLQGRIAQQEQMLRQQQTQQEIQQGVNALGQLAQQMQRNVFVQPVPQVMPLTPPGGNQIRCISVSSYTNCQY